MENICSVSSFSSNSTRFPGVCRQHMALDLEQMEHALRLDLT